ncbi:HAD-IA family hydrolase [Paenibacillus sp. GSMTC-2017]|uniref:HAD family hydrolase n=1 Tax=Paenibacillus sp. GSMTC-2017 TaxID=2794350 RepID=UPI0018D9E57E|nr:HAD-IA family hydrolase [Paenibacillus sp. GSMTC-2017]MBH5316978.1 HAD-IA family hydrolase [Paenibacillus sp. GSMTC-2017]
MKKTFIWFDLGYTLVYLPREQVYRQFLEENGINMSLEKLERAYHATDKQFMREYPGALGKEVTTFMPWYIGVLNYKLGLQFDLNKQSQRMQEIQHVRKQKWLPFPYSKKVLEQLKKHAIGIGLISNWDASARKVLEEGELLPYFDHIVISSEIGVEKPTEEIFLRAMRLAGLSPEECLYVGDNYYDDVVGSARVGMDSVLINRFGTYGIEELTCEHIVTSIEEVPLLLLVK